MTERRRKAAQLLRDYPMTRLTVKQVELALQGLTPVQRLVLEKLCIHPVKGNADWLCNALGCEKTTVYRHRAKALELFADALF